MTPQEELAQLQAEELAYLLAEEAASTPAKPVTTAAPTQPTTKAPETLDVFRNSLYKGAAAVPDAILNTPNRLLNLAKSAYGAGMAALDRPDLAPELPADPDLVRGGLEKIGLINKDLEPQTTGQKVVDVLGQGAVGGALTGGASIPRAAMGAGLGALSSGVGAGVEAKTGNPALGVAAGLVVPAAASRLAERPNLRPHVRQLADEGVQMTPGQIKGGVMQDIENSMTSWPIAGTGIKEAHREGHATLGRASMNRALAPIGETLPDGLVGNQAIQHTYQQLGNAYERLLPNLRGDLNVPAPAVGGLPPQSLADQLTTIRQMGTNFQPREQGQLNRIIDDEIVSRFTTSGLASGQTLKEIESQLGNIARPYLRSDDYDIRRLGGAVQEMQAALRRMVTNVNPQYEGELSKINRGYANFKVAQRAAASSGSREGVFTPAQLNQAVRGNDSSKGHARYSEGAALQQDLSQAGQAVLAPTVPDSGTAGRLLLHSMLHRPISSLVAGTAALPYAPFVQRGIQTFLTGESPALADAARRSTIPLSNEMENDGGALRQMWKKNHSRP